MFALDHSFLDGIEEFNVVLEPRAAEIVSCVLFQVDCYRDWHDYEVNNRGTGLSKLQRLFGNLLALPEPSWDLVMLWSTESLWNAYAHSLAQRNWQLAFTHQVWKIFFRGLGVDSD